MTCVKLKGRACDVVWAGRVAVAVALLPLIVPLVLLGPAQHVVREWLHHFCGAERPNTPR